VVDLAGDPAELQVLMAEHQGLLAARSLALAMELPTALVIATGVLAAVATLVLLVRWAFSLVERHNASLRSRFPASRGTDHGSTPG
jgi:hypothetical protein